MKSPATAVGLVLAAGVGYLLGVLFAPRSGQETRDEIGRRVRQTKKDVDKNS